MQGAARMVLEGQHPAIIRNAVATPGGCTIGGLLTMEDGKIRSTMVCLNKYNYADDYRRERFRKQHLLQVDLGKHSDKRQCRSRIEKLIHLSFSRSIMDFTILNDRHCS